ncbi:MAG: aminoacyl--tRNA ligase-related protein [Candidatus Paceibacterota bacterium]|jgi:prolyl-tRNA synthetase
MRQSELFTKTLRESPKEEVSINAKLLSRGGYIDRLMAGVYSYLPLGLLVLKNIENIIRDEMQKVGGQEVLLPTLTPKENWMKTDRWKYPEMFKLRNRAEKEYSLGWTHEEIITPLVQKFVNSYKDLPVYVYQFQNKFRDELRAKSGMLRGVEFMMKDLYSFHRDEKDLDSFYLRMQRAYFNVFERCGLKKETFLTLASGGAFAKYSHEFQMVTSFGEDEIYLCKKCKIAVNKEIIEEEKHSCPQCKSKDLEVKKSIEVGNIFKLQNRFTKPFGFKVKDEKGDEKELVMGCYGIGLSRLMGAVVEVHNDENGIIWPAEVAPFRFHLIPVGDVSKEADAIYQDLQKAGIKVLYDDRDRSAGEKFADSDLMGIPNRLVVSAKTLEKKSVELKERESGKISLVKLAEVKKI